MNTRIQNSTCFCLALFSMLYWTSLLKEVSASNAHVEIQKGVTTKAETRTFHFPKDYVVGALRVQGNEKDGTINTTKAIAKAQGDMTILVPPRCTVFLELSPKLILHPELLKNLQTTGINRLKLAYLSMDDEGHSECDKALAALPECKDIISLEVERSDVTDKGLASFKSLSSVQYLTAFGCALNGSILKETQKLKNLHQIDLMFNPIKGTNFKTLGELPNLETLNLNQTNISDEDVKYLPKCHALKTLQFLENKRITDKSLPFIQQQTSLDTLDLRGTSITLPGTLTLKNLKLKYLILTVRRYREEEIAQLKKAFPKAEINFRGGRVSSEDQVLYAPLK